MAATSIPMPAESGISRTLQRIRTEPAYAAFMILRVGFVLLPVVFGLDKFANVLTKWEGYLAPWVAGLLPFTPHIAMFIVGAVEIAAGIMIAVKPRYAAYVVAFWLAGIIINLLTYPGFYDVALRDFGLLVAALALAQLARTFDSGRSGRGITQD
ncbi:hypothetical protein QF031_002239 [Pseudarthrobacter defluvii]|uniref:hypothetical protein n=1 Tax=Pseudarthrobacter defluvii TaxID=410837 RepID=UPI00277D8A9A|nr:hypothetical protein [Pseudarthrobacter defluvii]MDQ0769490.1 hypothetical protein [Pseudarthrobacter defluvii]